MSVHYEAGRDRYVVRWRENSLQKSRQFDSRDDAEEFDAARRLARKPAG